MKALSAAVVGTRCGYYWWRKTGEPEKNPLRTAEIAKDGRNPLRMEKKPLRTEKTFEGRQKLSKDGKNPLKTRKIL